MSKMIADEAKKIKKEYRLTYIDIAGVIGYKQEASRNIWLWLTTGRIPPIWIPVIKKKLLTMTEKRAEKIYTAKYEAKIARQKTD